MSARVIHTGQAIVDFSLRVPAVPAPGADVFASTHEVCAGGGFNVMAAAARDGANVLYVGGHGTGYFGDLVRTAMAAEGIHVLGLPDPEVDTGFSIALVDDDAERSFISTLGAEGNVTWAQYRAAEPTGADVVYVSGYSLLHPRNRHALLEWLPTLPADTEVVADPSPVVAELDPATLESLLPHVTVWSTNEPEARVLAERAGLDTNSPPESIAAGLRDAWATTMICRRGAASTLVAPAGQSEVIHVPATPVTAIDTNGAGDAHCGVLCAALAAQRPLYEAVRRANVAAAIAVTRSGPATSPSATDIDAALSADPGPTS